MGEDESRLFTKIRNEFHKWSAVIEKKFQRGEWKPRAPRPTSLSSGQQVSAADFRGHWAEHAGASAQVSPGFHEDQPSLDSGGSTRHLPHTPGGPSAAGPRTTAPWARSAGHGLEGRAYLSAFHSCGGGGDTEDTKHTRGIALQHQILKSPKKVEV